MSGESMLWVNGKLVPLSQARIDPRDRGFTLGDGLFETLRARNGLAPGLPLHLGRLRRSAALIDLPLPWSDAQLASVVNETLAANALLAGVVRLTVSRGVPAHRGLLPEPTASPSLVVHAQPFSDYPAALYARGMRVITSDIRRNEYSPLAHVKTLGVLDNVLARQEAAAGGADEALLRNTTGNLACASAANLFLVFDGALVTPDVGSGVLPGTMRELVLTVLAPRLGLAVVERAVYSWELTAVSEAFLTSALLGVMPMTVVDDRPVGTGVPGPLTRRLGAQLAGWWSEHAPGMCQDSDEDMAGTMIHW